MDGWPKQFIPPHHERDSFHIYRNSFSHDVAEVAGLMAMSFGQDGVDRYTMVYKKDFAPTEDEIQARRLGDAWNEEKAKEYAQKVMDISRSAPELSGI